MIKIIFKGTSFGYFLVGIRVINIKTKHQVTHKEYTEYLLKNLTETTTELKATKVLHHYFNFDNRLAQNRAMKKSNLIAVNNCKYRSFLKEYEDTKQQIQAIEQEQMQTTHV